MVRTVSLILIIFLMGQIGLFSSGIVLAQQSKTSASSIIHETGPDPFSHSKPQTNPSKTKSPIVRKSSHAQNQGRGLSTEHLVTSLPAVSKRFALVIGVDSYSDPQVTGLKGAANDARLLSETLINHASFVPEQVLLLASDQPEANQPTRSNILQRLALLARSVPKDGMLLVAFSGHGVERNRQAFLLPSDAKVDLDTNLLNETCINVERIKEQIRSYGIQQVLLIMDTCRNEIASTRSGTFDKLNSNFTKALSFDLRNREVQAFATLYATSIGERAYEYSEKKHGYFTWALIEGLSGKASDDNGQVTLANLVTYVQNQVPKRVLLELGKEQHPFAEIGGYRADQLVVSASSAQPGDPQFGGGTLEAEKFANDPKQTRKSMTFQSESVTLDGFGNLVKRNPVKSSGYIEKLPNGVQLEMVTIPQGSFTMGATSAEEAKICTEFQRYGVSVEKAKLWAAWQTPQKQFSLSSYSIGRFEITQAQWSAVAQLPKVNLDLNPSPSQFKGDSLPVETISWQEAVEFCARLSQFTGHPYRLPTEAEWEYACRAGSSTGFAFGESINPQFVNYDGNYPYGLAGPGEFRGQTQPVGNLKITNAFGLFDMHGSVWEWCSDTFAEKLADGPGLPGRDVSVPNVLRSVRGGAWFNFAISCRSTSRAGMDSRHHSPTIGFRVVCESTSTAH